MSQITAKKYNQNDISQKITIANNKVGLVNIGKWIPFNRNKFISKF